ncbi:hypothetical protein V7794_10665 [Rhizobium laguerreae]
MPHRLSGDLYGLDEVAGRNLAGSARALDSEAHGPEFLAEGARDVAAQGVALQPGVFEFLFGGAVSRFIRSSMTFFLLIFSAFAPKVPAAFSASNACGAPRASPRFPPGWTGPDRKIVNDHLTEDHQRPTLAASVDLADVPLRYSYSPACCCIKLLEGGGQTRDRNVFAFLLLRHGYLLRIGAG